MIVAIVGRLVCWFDKLCRVGMSLLGCVLVVLDWSWGVAVVSGLWGNVDWFRGNVNWFRSSVNWLGSSVNWFGSVVDWLRGGSMVDRLGCRCVVNRSRLSISSSIGSVRVIGCTRDSGLIFSTSMSSMRCMGPWVLRVLSMEMVVGRV